MRLRALRRIVAEAESEVGPDHKTTDVAGRPHQTSAPSDTHATPVPRGCTLDGFIEVTCGKGVQLNDLDPLTELDVRTENSLYHIIVVHPHAGTVVVSGGGWCPTPVEAYLAGSGFGGSFLKMRWIGVGFRMELNCDDQVIITSHVRSIEFAAAPSRRTF
jgi:hypothetical protein